MSETEKYHCDECEFTSDSERSVTTHIASTHRALWDDEENLRQRFHKENMSQREMAELWDCSRDTVRNNMKKHGISTEHVGPFPCEECPSEYERLEDLTKHKDNIHNSDNPWDNQEKLYKEYTIKGRKEKDIANEWGCPPQTISDRVQTFELERRWRNEEILKKLYVEEGLTAAEIGRKLNCTKKCVCDWLRNHNIETRGGNKNDPQYPGLHDQEFLRKCYREKMMSYQEIADFFGCSDSAVHWVLEKYDIERDRVQPFPEEYNDYDFLHQKYVVEDKDTREIAKETDTSKASILRKLREHEIEICESGFLKGEEHFNWEEGPVGTTYRHNWLAQREKALERDDYKCRHCSMNQDSHKEEFGISLHVHHLQKRNSFIRDDGTIDYENAHALSNLKTLCQDCHWDVEYN